MEKTTKKWGGGEFWGVGIAYDYDWLLNDEQKKIRDHLMELCRTKIRPHAIHCDRAYEFPRQSLDAMAEMGLLGLLVPKKFGGMGQSNVCAVMVVETLARYGCPSTALVYTMHLAACSILLVHYHNNATITDLLKRLDKDKLVGTLCFSDPATGGHLWFSLSSKVKIVNDNSIKLLKYSSWTTSAGFADWYTVQTISPEFGGDYSNLSTFLVFKDEVRASTDDWSALGMHGNHSGPLVIEGVFTKDRVIGSIGGGARNGQLGDSYVHILTTSVWNGISFGCIDLAKKHVTRKAHADVGMRICDYSTIQDYFGDAVVSTNIVRSHCFLLAKEMDVITNSNDWELFKDLNFTPRSAYSHWYWIAKMASAKNVSEVSDKMLHACGGTGYKTELGLERLLRDAKAGWVMGLANEVIRQFIGNTTLFGMKSIDLWDQHCNERVVAHELNKMSLKDKKELARKLSEEVRREETREDLAHPYQDEDFENPFNTAPPTYSGKAYADSDGKSHNPALCPNEWATLKLLSRCDLNKRMAIFTFSFPNPDDYSGCLPGQYVQVRVKIGEKYHYRYFSPVSSPYEVGKIELVLRFETQGIISGHFQQMKCGDPLEFTGPCGGFEYSSNSFEELTFLVSGGGITPALQLIRCIMNSPKDSTKINLIYFSETIDDLLYKEELDRYDKDSEKMKITYTLGDVPENWEGEEGFIDTDMIRKLVTKSNGNKYKIIMCGGPTMIVSCVYSLRSLDYPSEAVFIYGQFGTEFVRRAYGRNIKLSGHR